MDAMQQRVDELSAMRRVFELVREPACIVDVALESIVEANQATCDALQLDYHQLIGRSWRNTISCLGDMSLCQVDPRHFVVVVHSMPLGQETTSISRDTLTGLATREVLLAHQFTDGSKRILAPAAMLFIDLDDFKSINDAWGHLVGDYVLRLVGERILASIRPSDLAVRFGGDEFLVLVQGISAQSDLNRLVRRIKRKLSQLICVGGRVFAISASIGIARQIGQSTIEELIHQADRAMYRSKRHNRRVLAHNALRAKSLSRGSPDGRREARS